MKTKLLLPLFLTFCQMLTATTWTPTVAISKQCSDDDAPAMTTDKLGNSTIVYLCRTADFQYSWLEAAKKPTLGNWSAPVLLSEKAQNNKLLLKASVDLEGNTVALWNFQNDKIFTAILPFGSEQWVTIEPLAASQTLENGASLIFDGQGNAICVIEDLHMSARLMKGTLKWQTLPSFKSGIWFVNLNVDKKGTVWLIGNSNGNVIVSSLDPLSNNWTDPFILAEGNQQYVYPQIVFDDQGGALATWQTVDNQNNLIFEASRYDGKNWTKTQFQNVEKYYCEGWLSFDSDGTALFVWWSRGGIDDMIFASKLPPGKLTWTEPSMVANGSIFFSHANLIDKTGNRLLAWRDAKEWLALKYSILPASKEIWSTPITILNPATWVGGNFLPDGTALLIYTDGHDLKSTIGSDIIPE